MTGIIIPDPAGGLVGIHYWDGTTWQKWTGTAPSLFVNIHGYDGTDWQKLLATTGGLLRLAAEADAQRLYVTQTDPDDLRVGPYGRYSSAWQRQPLIFGFSAPFAEEASDTSASAGANTLALTAVPANTLRVITNILAFDVNSAITRIDLRATIGGTIRDLARLASPAANVGINWQGHLYLGPTDDCRARFTGVTLNDDIYLDAHGYDMALAAA